MKVSGMLGVIAVVAIVVGQEPLSQQQQLQRDQLRAAVQQICPVSGRKLGAQGSPVKIAVGEHKEQVFLCCRGCLRGKIDPRHWATIHKNFASAQRICPVMKHELPDNAEWTILQGQIVYICCPPCTEQLEADPPSYLRQLDQLYSASLEKAARR